MRKLTALILALVLVAAACSSSSDTFGASEPTPTDGGGETGGGETGGGETGGGETGGGETGGGETGGGETGGGETGGGETGGGGLPTAFSFVASLQPFDACEDFLTHIRGEAVERVGPYGLDGLGGYFPGPIPLTEREFAADDAIAVEETAPAEPAADGGGDFDNAGAIGGPEAGVDFSETNVQVEGVDEPDIVKTDGERIITVTNNTLQVTDVRGGDAVPAGRVFLDSGWNQQLLIDGDLVLVIGNGDGYAVYEDFAAETSIAPDFAPWIETTIVQLVDISGGEAVVESTLRMEGRYVAAREIDGTARLVMTSPPSQLQFVYPQGPAAEDVARDANRQIVMESTLEQWLPDYVFTDRSGLTTTGQLLDCDRIHRPAEFAGFDQLSVITIDIDSELRIFDATSVIAAGETVYASASSLYVATSVWANPIDWEQRFVDEFEEKFETSIHRFDIAGDSANYVASGSVRGHLLNQFSMDEYDGRIRVATTDGSPWGFSDSNESYITVLETQGDELVEVGQVGDMGRGERIFSVRYVGELAYVVTFRQVDPFYVVDLSDPTDPDVVGELKIPGYSSYLHPISDGLILGVGQDADEQGFTTGAKVSAFDVSDPTNPTQLSTWTVPGGYTDVEWDHRAFLWWAPQNIAVLPLNLWQEDFNGAVILEVTGTQIREVGRIDHNEAVGEFGATGCRTLDPSELGQWGEDLRFEFEDGGAVAIVCGPDDPATVSGFYCDPPIPALDAPTYYGYGDFELEAAASDTFSLCWREYYGGADPIMRTLVVDDNLWSMSWRFLQANDLDTLERMARVPIT